MIDQTNNPITIDWTNALGSIIHMIGLMHKDRSDGLIIIDQTNAQ
jgi:hypothetical protein